MTDLEQLNLGFGPDLDTPQVQLLDAVQAMNTRERFHLARAIAGREWRDPTGATLKATYTGPGQPQIQQFDPETAITMSYLLNAIVYACVQAIAGAFTQASFKVGKGSQSGRLAHLLGPPPGTPCPRFSARKFWHWSVRAKTVTGKCGWEIECAQPRGKGEIVRLWPLVPHLLAPIPTDGGVDFYEGFVYGPPGKKKRRLANEQVFYNWTPDLRDVREPESALMPSRYDIGAANMFDRYTVALLKNNNIPANVISYLPFEDEEEELAWQRQFTARHQGPDAAGRSMFHKVADIGGDMADVKGALHIHQLGAIQRDTQALETYRVKVTNICIAMGVPMSMLDASNRTFSNGGLEAQNFYQQRMKPEWQEWAEEANSQIGSRCGGAVGEFDFTHIEALRPPTKFQQINPVALRDAEIVKRDEIRDELGLDPWTPEAGGVDADADAEQLKTLASAASILIQNGFDREDVLKKLGLPAIKVAPAPAAPSSPAGSELEPDLVDTPPQPLPPVPPVRSLAGSEIRSGAAQEAAVTVLERRWQEALAKFFRRQLAATLSRLQGNRGKQMLRELRDVDSAKQHDYTSYDNVFEPTFWYQASEDLASNLYEDVFLAGGTRVASQFAITFDVTNPEVTRLIQERASFLADKMNTTTLDELRGTLADGVDAGEDIAQLTDRVQTVFDDRSEAGAERIARTEVVGAYQQASHLYAAGLPSSVVAGHSWHAHLDNRTRESHRDPELSKPIPLGQPFRVGGVHMLHPGDPAGGPDEVINCRCAEVFYSPDEMEKLSARSWVGRHRALKVLQSLDAGQIDETAALAAIGG